MRVSLTRFPGDTPREIDNVWHRTLLIAAFLMWFAVSTVAIVTTIWVVLKGWEHHSIATSALSTIGLLLLVVPTIKIT